MTALLAEDKGIELTLHCGLAMESLIFFSGKENGFDLKNSIQLAVFQYFSILNKGHFHG